MDQQSNPQDPRDRVIADMQAQLQHLQVRLANVENILAGPAQTTSEQSDSDNASKKQRWVIAGIVVASGVLIFLLLALGVISAARPTGDNLLQTVPVAAHGVTETPTSDSASQFPQATVTALAKTATRLYGPAKGNLIHSSDSSITIYNTYLFEQDFIAEAQFHNPYDSATTGWDYGFMFRRTSVANEYRLYVTSNQEWALKLVEVPTPLSVPTHVHDSIATPTTGPLASSSIQSVAGGAVDNLDTSKNGSNLLRLVVQGGTGYFFVNNEYIATLDLLQRVESGDIAVGTAFQVRDKKPGAMTSYSALSVWGLPPSP